MMMETRRWSLFLLLRQRFLELVVVVAALCALMSSSSNNLLVVVQAQEAANPTMTFPLFTRAQPSARQDMCDRSLQVVQRLISPSEAISGMDIHVALADGAFVNFDYDYDDDGNPIRRTARLNASYPGLVPRLLDTICERANCTWRNTYAPIFYEDMSEDQTFLQLLEWSTQMYDVNAEWWARSVTRLMAGVSFAEQWYDGSIIMVGVGAADADKDEFDPWGWLAPFDASVWYLVLGTIVFSALVYWILEVLNPNSDSSGDEHGAIIDPVHSTWMFATAFAGQFEFDPQTGPARLFTFSIAFWSLLMTSAYTANLASFLVIRNTPGLQFNTVDDAVSHGVSMCVWRSTRTDETITEAFPTYAASGKLKRTDQRGVFEGLNNGECEIAITEVSSFDAFQNDITVNKGCNLGLIGRTYKFLPASFAFKSDAGILCTSLLRDVFNLYMFEMEHDGTIDALWQEYMRQTATVDCSLRGGGGDNDDEEERRLQSLFAAGEGGGDYRRQLSSSAKSAAPEANGEGGGSDEDTTKLSLVNMGGVFMVHGVLSGISIICALLPWLYQRYFRGKNGSSTAANSFTKEDEISFDKVGENPLSELSFRSTRTNPRDGDVLDLRVELNARLSRIEEKLGITSDERGGGGWFQYSK